MFFISLFKCIFFSSEQIKTSKASPPLAHKKYVVKYTYYEFSFKKMLVSENSILISLYCTIFYFPFFSGEWLL